MFKRKSNGNLPKHIEIWAYKRTESIQDMTPEQIKDFEDFYERNGVKHYDLTHNVHSVLFKRTLNYVYVVAHTYSKNAEAVDVTTGVGIIRTKAFVFYRGTILYTLDHDDTRYPCAFTGHTTTKQRKCIKLNYGVHDELNNLYLRAIGRQCDSLTKFNSACLDLLKNDNEAQSINFIREA